MARLTWHVDALADLNKIAEFIALSSPRYAPLFVRRVKASANRLVSFPLSGRVVPEIGSETYREIIFQNYRIVYRPLGARVSVIGVVHGAMDMERLARARRWEIN